MTTTEEPRSDSDSVEQPDGDSVSQDGKALPLSRQEFNKNRAIIIRGIPPATYEEIKDFMGGHGVRNITISKKHRHAVVSLSDGGKAEEVVGLLQHKRLLGEWVSVSLHPQETLLCVTQLPFNFEEKDLSSFAGTFGGLIRCFLLCNENTGKSKGYGFIEFAHNKEKSDEAREQIDGRKFGSCVIRCQFVSPNVLAYADLHSKCLFIDHLPPNYTSTEQLKQLLTLSAAPSFFQLGIQNGKGLGFAVAEFRTIKEAEETQETLNGHQIHGHKIRVTYCAPGEEGETIYNRMVGLIAQNGSLIRPGLLPNPRAVTGSGSSQTQKSGTPLLPDPAPSAAQPIPSLQDRTAVPRNITAGPPKNQPLVHYVDLVMQHMQEQKSGEDKGHRKPGLLGHAPGVPHVPSDEDTRKAELAVAVAMQLQQRLQPGQSDVSGGLIQQVINSLTGAPQSAVDNSRSQRPPAADKPSWSHNKPPPHDHQDRYSSGYAEPKPDNKGLLPLPQAPKSGLLGSAPPARGPPFDDQRQGGERTSLLGNGPASSYPPQPAQPSYQEVDYRHTQPPPPPPHQQSRPPPPASGPPPSGWSQGTTWAGWTSAAENKPSLLGRPDSQHSQKTPSARPDYSGAATNRRPQDASSTSQYSTDYTTSKDSKLSEIAQQAQEYAYYQSMYYSQHQSGGSNTMSPTYPQQQGDPNQTKTSSYDWSQTPTSNTQYGSSQYPSTYSQSAYNDYYASYNRTDASSQSADWKVPTMTAKEYQEQARQPDKQPLLPSQDSQYYAGYGSSSTSQGSSSQYYSPPTSSSGYGGAPDQYSLKRSSSQSSLDSAYGGSVVSHDLTGYGRSVSSCSTEGGSMVSPHHWTPPGPQQTSSPVSSQQNDYSASSYSQEYTQQYYPETHNQTSTPGPSQSAPAAAMNPQPPVGTKPGAQTDTMSTPKGQKRPFPHLLPSPEASPNGGYIGQHSQGIGGHYADSYYKRKRKS